MGKRFGFDFQKNSEKKICVLRRFVKDNMVCKKENIF